ncbi:hypothetical protein Zmor_003832 [Zophobas morio]|uniref:CCHC-type domain-containing protein n=1 Tax=Zophobas morio TaxID=2755281 RepID=A0AA38M2C9_9CUCU|nr:hypothetical protein Zmor_003832 [Zophobas morio]
MANRDGGRRENWRGETNKTHNGKQRKDAPVLRCFKCRQPGHKAAECRNKNNRSSNEKRANNVCLQVYGTARAPARDWCLDSGATTHLCNDIGLFREIDCSRRGVLNLANDSATETTGEGTVLFEASAVDGRPEVSLRSALHVPDLRTNLLSVSKITDRGFEVCFRRKEATICDQNGRLRLRADRVGDLYCVHAVEPATARAPGRPRIVRTGSRGRPRKVHRTVSSQNLENVTIMEAQDVGDVANVEHTFMSKIPMKEAMRGPDVEDWRRAIADEIKSVLKNETFKLVDRPR